MNSDLSIHAGECVLFAVGTTNILPDVIEALYQYTNLLRKEI